MYDKRLKGLYDMEGFEKKDNNSTNICTKELI